MAKSKNHTNHNQNSKAHRNGIKRVNKHVKGSIRYMDPKYLHNLKMARKHNVRHVVKKGSKWEAKAVEKK
ncbi:putative large subunit ribosomal protein L29e [Blattamonas nauphoetae]|nr:putative large subunit ribosomal protein L29e [Blattamonas nauphoetae]